MSKYNLYIKQMILHLKNYIKSEELIFDVAILSFILIFDYIVPHSRDKMLDLLQHRPINEFIVVLIIQLIISFNVGRYIERIPDATATLSVGCLTILSYSFIFFLFLFPAFFIEQSWFYIGLGLLLGILAIYLGLMFGIGYEEDFINSKKNNKKIIKILIRIFLIALSYSALMLYQTLMMEAWGLDTVGLNIKSIVLVLIVAIITGILQYRILLLIEPPVSFFGVFMGIAVIFIDLFKLF